jgi:PPOX class probable FMN-dependent enzyme
MSEICTLSDLRTRYAQPSEIAVRKELDHIDKHARNYISRAPFVVISTCDADGWPDGSPRGDAPGFVAVIDEHRLHLPDRPGNNRLDSFQNLLANPRIALLFLVPQRTETLRVNGTARLLTDPDLLQKHAVRGKPARAVVEVTAKSVYYQCGKALIRSQLWHTDKWPSTEGLASLGEAIADQIGGMDKAASEERLQKAYRDGLY